jgi:hypothetical protein
MTYIIASLPSPFMGFPPRHTQPELNRKLAPNIIRRIRVCLTTFSHADRVLVTYGVTRDYRKYSKVI